MIGHDPCSLGLQFEAFLNSELSGVFIIFKQFIQGVIFLYYGATLSSLGKYLIDKHLILL